MAPNTVLDRVEDAVRRRGADLVELSHAIHAEPELAFEEYRSCAKAQALVAERGFEITPRAGGLDTAFRADFGSGPLGVGAGAASFRHRGWGPPWGGPRWPTNWA